MDGVSSVIFCWVVGRIAFHRGIGTIPFLTSDFLARLINQPSIDQEESVVLFEGPDSMKQQNTLFQAI